MVLGAVGLIDLVGDREQRVEGIHANASLKAGSRELPEPPLHPILHHHVFGTLRHVKEAIDPPTAD